MNHAAVEYLVRLGQDFHRRGWALGTSGNFSAVIGREPLRLAITASSVDKSRLTADQILEIDENGRVLSGGEEGTRIRRPFHGCSEPFGMFRSRGGQPKFVTGSAFSLFFVVEIGGSNLLSATAISKVDVV